MLSRAHDEFIILHVRVKRTEDIAIDPEAPSLFATNACAPPVVEHTMAPLDGHHRAERIRLVGPTRSAQSAIYVLVNWCANPTTTNLLARLYEKS
jgi:hypothetical protein